MIVDSYEWLLMTPTVHKIIADSRQVIENTVLPEGYFGEEASESHSKVYKEDRLHHARKHSRIHNFADVFNRAMDSSEPVISSTKLIKRVRKCDKA